MRKEKKETILWILYKIRELLEALTQLIEESADYFP